MGAVTVKENAACHLVSQTGHRQTPAGRDQRESSHWSQSHALKIEQDVMKNSFGPMILLLVTNDTKETKENSDHL